MASSSSSSSSSLSSPISPQQKDEIQEKYDVFLSFRGEDTRNQFTTYLFEALSAKHILTFMDHQLERGDEVYPTLNKAIEESKISVIIFSENYASSTWCLDELVHILECKKNNGQTVMPIFYGINPSVVRKQSESYGDAFANLEDRFKDNMKKVQQWRDALTEASNLCGLDSTGFRPESKLVERIVEDISLKLPKIYQPSNEHYKGGLIGIEKSIEEIKSLLSIGSKDIRIIGIWGMGGIGKTTLAEVLYEELSNSQFDGCCSFLPNVTKKYARHGPGHLRKKLLSQLVNDKDILNTPFVTSSYILDKLRSKKVLIVLDDVSDSIQLDSLIKGYDQLAHGSRIIVTTRDLQVVKKVAKKNIYQVEGLSHNESLELFHLHAFDKNSPPIDDKTLLKRVVSYADGNPLALKVLGSFLHSRNKQDWENVLYNLENFPDQDKILNVLRISYEGLDKWTQNIFLDIACLFNGSFIRNEAERLLDNGDSLVKIRMDVLIEKSLIEDHGKYWKGNKLRMHDLLRQMGHNIVCDGHRQPGDCSRPWDAKDVCNILEKNTGTIAVEVISFNMSQMTRDVKVSREVFAKMCNLRILKIYCDHIHNIGDNKVKLLLLQGLDSYPFEKLNYFHWDLYPLKSLPRNFTPENLIELVLRGSRVQKLWNHEVQSFPVLKRMDFSYSKLLTEIPYDLSQQAPNLESINLEGCTSLVQVLPSVQNLHKLTYINLDGCSKLIEFKEIISRSRWYLDLIKSGGIMNFLSNICQQKLTFLKSFINNIWSLSSPAAHMCQQFPMNLTVLRLSGTPVEEVPLSIGSLSGLAELDLRNCKQLKSLPTSIWNVKSLKSLYMSGCVKLGKLPEISEPMEHLTSLWLNETGIEELPESIDKLISLKLFDLKRCKAIEFLPNKLCELRKLENLSLEGCSKLENLPNSLPPALYSLDVQFCESLKSIPDLPLSFGHLNARHCTSLEKIPDWKAALQPQLIHRSKHAEYFGCGKLDQNTRNTVLPDYAISEILNHGNLEDHFCYPGDEIPKWFSNQTNLGTTVLKIKLPPFWNNDNFLGFTLCVVLDLKKIKPWVDAFVKFELNFKTNDPECPQESFSKELFWANEECLDHVFMWHVPKVSFRRLKNLKWPSSCSGEASLHVCPTFYDNTIRRDVKLGSEYSEIKKWGVRFINKEDVERFNAETIQNRRKRLGFDDECSEASGSGSGSDQFVPSGSHDELEDDDA